MKIGIDARMFGTQACTGVGQYIKQLTKHLFEIDEQNEYVLFLQQEMFEAYQPPNDRVQKVLAPYHWYTYSEQLRLPFKLMGHDLDLIHYPHFNSPIFFAKKSVCTIHDLTPFRFDGHKMKSGLRKAAHRLVFKNTVSRAEKILTVSNNTKQDLISKFKIKSDKVAVTHLGVDDSFYPIKNHDIIKQVLNKYGITEPFIFFIGAWRNHKNLEGLILAYNKLKEKYNLQYNLVLGGKEDPHYPNIRNLIEKSPYKKQIITPGFIADEDMPALYSAAEVFVMPSFLEGFGLIAIEAQKCGCPVLSSNTSCMPEVLENSAVYFNPKNTLEMAHKIYQVLNDEKLKQKLILKGFDNAQRFSWQNCAKQTLKIYNQALNN